MFIRITISVSSMAELALFFLHNSVVQSDGPIFGLGKSAQQIICGY